MGPRPVGPSALNYSDVDDSFASMKIRAAYRHFTFPYLYDGETQAVSEKYGPKVTPHIFIFDAARKLRYEGRIDDRLQEAKASVHDARNALDQLIAGQPVAVAHTPVFGCSHQVEVARGFREERNRAVVVRAGNSEERIAQRSAIAAQERDRQDAHGQFLGHLVRPLPTEYPQLLETYLWYRSRDFEFVSVSWMRPCGSPEGRAIFEQDALGHRQSPGRHQKMYLQ